MKLKIRKRLGETQPCRRLKLKKRNPKRLKLKRARYEIKVRVTKEKHPKFKFDRVRVRTLRPMPADIQFSKTVVAPESKSFEHYCLNGSRLWCFQGSARCQYCGVNFTASSDGAITLEELAEKRSHDSSGIESISGVLGEIKRRCDKALSAGHKPSLIMAPEPGFKIIGVKDSESTTWYHVVKGRLKGYKPPSYSFV